VSTDDLPISEAGKVCEDPELRPHGRTSRPSPLFASYPPLQHPFLSTCLAVGLLAGLAGAETLYTIEDSTDRLCMLDTTTGVVTPIGQLNVSFLYGDLAYDTSTGTLYMSNGWATSPSQLYTVNLQTGAATLVGSMGANEIFGLAYDQVSNRLYASRSINGTGFYEIERSTGAATLVGTPGVHLEALTWVGSTGELVGLRAGAASLHLIDPSDGSQSLLVSGSGFIHYGGMAWSSTSNRVFVLDLLGGLYQFDPTNGYARTTLLGGLGNFDGLVSVNLGCPTPTAYCTASTSTAGCVATIAATGAASATATSGFQISVSGLEGQRSTLFFYGTSGQAQQPWAIGSTSFLCVKSPTQRTFTASSGGTVGACDGSLTLDWLAYMAGNPWAIGQPLVPGAGFDGQFWFRDPPAPRGTNLSDALHWTLCP
jgi:hypothetical protein